MQTGTNFSESFTPVYEDELSFLEKSVVDYPVSAFALFLLLQKYQQSGDERYDHLLQKASVYFPNHTWLKYQLSGDDSMLSIPQESITATVVTEEELPETTDPVETIFSEPEIQSENILVIPEEKAIENTIEEKAIREMEKEEMVEFVRGEKAENFEETFIENEANKEGELITDPLPEEDVQEENKEERILESGNKDQNDLSEEKITERFRDTGIEETDTEPIPEAAGTGIQAESEKADTHTEKISGHPSPTSPKEQEKADKNQSIEFEPLHTIDYFASQGIIIREEALMNDKLGKQMKSFTDWLKSMKKLHPGKLPEQNEVVEKIIQSSAELSNEDAGVLTEAMADVLIKQGKREKAIEMFEKLSLMNPSKSIYFAAKIESLKK